MTYYFYENWRAHGHRAKIHFAECGSCQNGQGQQLHAGDENGKWHGPYGTVQVAYARAVATGARVLPCGHCRPVLPE
jgi:hypothetical protein